MSASTVDFRCGLHKSVSLALRGMPTNWGDPSYSNDIAVAVSSSRKVRLQEKPPSRAASYAPTPVTDYNSEQRFSSSRIFESSVFARWGPPFGQPNCDPLGIFHLKSLIFFKIFDE